METAMQDAHGGLLNSYRISNKDGVALWIYMGECMCVQIKG